MAEKNDLENCNNINSKNSVEKGKLDDMFRRIINGDHVNIKSQQRTETDLTSEEKTAILKDLYERSPASFLTRFGRWLPEEDLDRFSETTGDYEIDYTIKKLKKNLAERASRTGVKNRRYEALRRLENDSNYFTEDEMRQRCPLLYEQYIGQFMTDDEKVERDEKLMRGEGCEVTMSSFIFQQIDREWLRNRQDLEREEEECMEEEEEDDEEEEEEEQEEQEEEYEKQESEDIQGNTSSEPSTLSEEEKLLLRQEFLNIMKQNFLEGRDKDFDYSKIDTNEEYDNLTILGQDAEDKYFDEEEPETSNNGKSNQETMSTDSDDDYLSDTILQKCCSVTR